MSKTKLDQLNYLAHWCGQKTSLALPGPLSEIIVTPKANIAVAANDFIAKSGETSEVRTSADAIAVPRIMGGRLDAAIILDAKQLEAFDQGQSAIDYLALTILEEMLHVRHYAITFDRRGAIRYALPDPCQSTLMDLVYHLLDEYVAGRWKAELVEVELSYGGYLPSVINRGLRELAYVVRAAAMDELEVVEAWARTAAIISGSTFGALVREAGRRAGRSAAASPAGDPSESNLYNAHVRDDWVQMLPHFKAAYEDLRKADSELVHIASHLKSFLMHCGVSLTPMAEGGCWINFARLWADAITEGDGGAGTQ